MVWLLLAIGSALSAVGFCVLGDVVFQPVDENDVRARQFNLLMTVFAVCATMLCAVFLLFWIADLVFAPIQGLEGGAGGGMD
jgi:hypothetical protein